MRSHVSDKKLYTKLLYNVYSKPTVVERATDLL